MNREVEKFKSKIQPFLEGWKSIEVRIISTFLFDRWINLATEFLLRSESPEEISLFRKIPEIENFRILNAVFPIGNLDNLLLNLNEKGILSIDGNGIFYGRKEKDEFKPQITWSFDAFERKRSGVDFYAFELYEYGESVRNFLEYKKLEEFKDGLKKSKHPYAGIDDLIREFFHSEIHLSHDTSTTLKLIAPIRVNFSGNCKIQKNQLCISIQSFGWEEMEEVSLNLIQYLKKGNPARQSYEIQKAEWIKEGNHLLFEKKFNLNDQCREIKVFLIFKGESVDEQNIFNPGSFLDNPRIIIHSYFDKELTLLKKYLTGQGKNSSSDFEIGVSWLLNLCGFITTSYGLAKQIQNEIDIVASLPGSNKIIAVECTTESIDIHDKLSRLSVRSKKLEGCLNSHSQKVIPLVFTCLDEDKIPDSEKDKAKKDKIGIISAEKIEKLLNISLEANPGLEVLGYLEKVCFSEETGVLNFLVSGKRQVRKNGL